MHKQRGSLVLYGLLALVAISAVGAAFYSYNNAISEAEKLKGEKKALQIKIDEQEKDKLKLKEANDINILAINVLKAEKEQLQQINAKRIIRVQTVAAKEKKTDEKLILAITKEPISKAWADTYVPDDIVASLRNEDTSNSNSNDKDGSGKTTSTEGISSPSTDTWLAGEVDQLAIAKSSAGMEETSTSL